MMGYKLIQQQEVQKQSLYSSIVYTPTEKPKSQNNLPSVPQKPVYSPKQSNPKSGGAGTSKESINYEYVHKSVFTL